MLEVVGVELAVLKGGVGQDVVVKDNDVQLVALRGQNRLDLLKDLRVGRGGGADRDHNGLGGRFSRGLGGSGSFGSGGSGSGAAGAGAAADQNGDGKCKDQKNGQ